VASNELFSLEDIKQCRSPLTTADRENAVRNIIRKVKLNTKFFYTLKETCGILHCTYDELLTIINQYRLDVVMFLSVYRIPWWDLCGYLIDEPEDDLEEALNEYLRSIARRNSVGKID
jgi:predicted DNA-binding ribbon-helix-helix protein